MRKLFGTDGIRGVANTEPMTSEMALTLGRAAAYVLRKGNGRHKVLIGKDTRLSCYMIENALAAGFLSMGVDAYMVGPLPTPGIAFLTHSMRADAGVVISASHNSFQDNGIKFFDREGFKLPDSVEEEIEDLMDSKELYDERPTGADVGRAFRIDDAVGRYVVYLKHTFPKAYKLDGVRIVLDCANGAGYKAAYEVFSELGADLVVFNNKPDGTNINRKCGALHPEVICDAVKEYRANIGIALDGDADRVIFADEHGNTVNGDHIMALCARDMIDKGRLVKNTVVCTVMSNIGLERSLKEAGGRMVRTDVGDRYVVEKMRQDGYNLGGEQSGHLLFLDHGTTGDGVMSALQVLSVMVMTGRSLSELTGCMVSYPQVLESIRVREKRELGDIAGLMERIGEVEKDLGDSGRVLVRYSGTENVARVMLEGEDEKQIKTYCDDIVEIIEKEIGTKGERP